MSLCGFFFLACFNPVKYLLRVGLPVLVFLFDSFSLLFSHICI